MADIKKRTILITGGGGYIGSTLCKVFIENNFKVRVLDLLLYGRDVFKDVIDSPDFELIQGDVRDEVVIDTVTKGVDAIIHLAAIVGAPESSRIPELTWSINLDGTKKLYEVAKRKGVKRFIFSSTVSNYGAVGTDVAVDEESALDPISPYSESKVAAEKFLKEQMLASSEMCVTIMRFATVFGVSPRMRFDLLLNEFTRDAYLKKAIDVFGNQGRTFIHVQDVASAVMLVLNSSEDKVCSQVFNVGDDRFSNMTKFDLGKTVADTIGDVKFNPVEKILDNRDYKVSFKKINMTLGFECAVSPADGVREIIKFMDQNKTEDFYSSKYSNLEKYLNIQK